MKFTSNRFVLLFSVLAGLQVIAGAAGLGDLVGKDTAAIFVLAVGAVQVGATFYVTNQITPSSEVVAVASHDGLSAEAGPAAHLATGTPVRVIDAGSGDPVLDHFDNGV